MPKSRPVRQLFTATPVLEGAGVHLKRVFGHAELPLFDPFLLLDDFRSDNPAHYQAGFPWHPHRGIETITYVLTGEVDHGDSLGNTGTIGAGDVQWMTAGSGIIHQEMPRGDGEGRLAGFQLWANLPASHKMMEPRYREVVAGQIPELTLDDGVKIRIICGRVGDTAGPVTDIVIDPEYLDISLPAGAGHIHPTRPGHTVLAYVIGGNGSFGGQPHPMVANGQLVLFGDGDQLSMAAGQNGMRLLLCAGRPLREPVAWRGPIVMNSQAELEEAFADYRNNTFIRHRPA